MNRLFILLTLLLCAIFSSEAIINHSESISDDATVAVTQSSTQKFLPVVEDGKTWWYGSQSYAGHIRTEWGMRIGEIEEIDGILWHKLTYPMRDYYNYQTGWKRIEDNAFIGHIREDDNGSIYLRWNPSDAYNFATVGYWLWNVYRGLITKPYADSPFGDSIIVEHRGRPGVVGDVYPIGDESQDYLNILITDVEEIENMGVSRKVFTTKALNDCNPFDGEINHYIEGIGWDMPGFFNPMASICSLESIPYLKYVTDKDNNIVFEGVGGPKIWQEPVGVEEVAVDVAKPQYFNLQGIHIEVPSQPGVYIERKGSKTRKVYIK